MRVDNWPAALAVEIDKARGRPFEWGTEHDCLGLVGCVHTVLTGTDSPFKQAIGQYDDRRSAAQALKDNGFASYEALVSSVLPEISPKLAQRGDVASFATGLGPALGVCLGNFAVLVNQSGGLTHKPMKDALSAWRI